MRNTLVLASFVFLAGNTSHCNLSGPVNPPEAGGFNHSVSTFMCGPADGPATAILLARDSIEGLQPSNPYIRVVIQRRASELAGTTWLVGVMDDVSAVYVADSSRHEEAIAGTVRITRVVAQERIEGSVDLRFPSRNVTEAFSAPWIESLMLCG